MVRLFLFSDKGKCAKWEAGLIWFRLRYLEPPTRVVNLLSRPEACGRVALYYRPGDPVSQLFIGIPQTHARLLERMAADFGFSLSPRPPEETVPPARPMTVVTDLPWDRAFVAHITNEFSFVSLENEGDRGSYLPQPPSAGLGPAKWTLPVSPPPGLTLTPSWNGHRPPSPLAATVPEAGGWPLGRTSAGVPLSVCGQINLYGRQAAVADWLVEQVAQMVTLDHANLVVIDGTGDLVPRLKRQAAVTRLLGQELAYIDLDGPPLAGGFNPLAAVPGETEVARMQRWQQWFAGMSSHPEAIQLLAQARQAGVGDIPALGKWLKQVGRQQQTALSSLGLTLDRLMADPNLREWLAWPVNRFEILPAGALFFTCKELGWAYRQLVQMVLLSAMQVQGVRLVVHGVPWTAVDLSRQERFVVSNAPPWPDSTVVLTQCHAQGAAVLAKQFLNGDLQMQENLELLRRREGMIVTEAGAVLACWKNGRIS